MQVDSILESVLRDDGKISLIILGEFPLVPNEIYLVCAPFFSIHPASFLLENTPLSFRQLEGPFLGSSDDTDSFDID